MYSKFSRLLYSLFWTNCNAKHVLNHWKFNSNWFLICSDLFHTAYISIYVLTAFNILRRIRRPIRNTEEETDHLKPKRRHWTISEPLVQFEASTNAQHSKAVIRRGRSTYLFRWGRQIICHHPSRITNFCCLRLYYLSIQSVTAEALHIFITCSPLKLILSFATFTPLLKPRRHSATSRTYMLLVTHALLTSSLFNASVSRLQSQNMSLLLNWPSK